MKKILEWLKPKSFLLFSVLLVILIVILYGMRYYNTDDLLRRQILLGSEEFNPSIYLINSPSYVGWIYSLLYKVAPGLEWYTIVYLAIVLLCFRVLLKRLFTDNLFYNLTVFLLICFVVLFILKDLITQVHFTTLACLPALCAGILYAERYANAEFSIKSCKTWLLPAVFLCLGFSFRLQAALLVFALTVVFIILDALILGRRNLTFPLVREFLKAGIWILLFALLPVMGFKWTEPAAVKKYGIYSDNFRNIFDYHLIDKVDNKATFLRQASWDTSELNIVKYYIIPGTAKYSDSGLARLNEKLAVKNIKREIGTGILKESGRKTFLLFDNKFPLVLLVLIFIISISSTRLRMFLWLGASLLLLWLAVVLLTLFLKSPPEYLLLPLFIALLAVGFYRLKYSFNSWKRIFNVYILITVVLAGYVARKNQTEFFTFLGQFKKFSEGSNTVLSTDKKYVSLSMRNHDYVYPEYGKRDWWRKQNLNQVFFLSPFTFHPTYKRYSDSERVDIIYRSVKDSTFRWIFAHGYEEDIPYVENTLCDYYIHAYGKKVHFEIDSTFQNQPLRILRLKE